MSAIYFNSEKYIPLADAAAILGISENDVLRVVRENYLYLRAIGKLQYVSEQKILALGYGNEAGGGVPEKEASEISDTQPAINDIVSRSWDEKPKQLSRVLTVCPPQARYADIYVGFRKSHIYSFRPVLVAMSLIAALTTGTYAFTYPSIQSEFSNIVWESNKQFAGVAQSLIRELREKRGQFTYAPEMNDVYVHTASGVLAVADVEEEIASSTPERANTSQTPQTIINSPVIERIIEKQTTVVQSGITLADLDALKREFDARLAIIESRPINFSGPAASTPISVAGFAASQRIDTLNSVDISDSTISGSTLTNPTLSGATISSSTFSGSTLSVTGNVTLGNATSTSIFATTASSTNLFATSATFAGLTAGTVSFNQGATTTFSGGTVFSRVPSIAHAFSSWTIGAANVNPFDASLLINPASSIADGNLFAAAVGGSVKFLIDAEGDVFANNLTLVGATTLSTTTASTFSVENNATFGDSLTDAVLVNGTLLVMSSSTLQNFTFLNATGTNATTTSFFSTTASSSILFANNATTTTFFAATASSTNLFARGATTTSLFSTTASTTQLFTTRASSSLFTVLDTGYFPGSGIWNSSGNLGSGTTSPQDLVHVAKDQNAFSGLRASNFTTGASASAGIRFDTDAGQVSGALFQNSSSASAGYGGANALNLINVRSAPLTLGVGNAVNMTISSSGNVGIGSTTPSAKLAIEGSFYATSSRGLIDTSGVAEPSYTATGVMLRARAATPYVVAKLGTASTDSAFSVYNSSDTLVMAINANGNLTVGSTGDTTYRIYALGAASTAQNGVGGKAGASGNAGVIGTSQGGGSQGLLGYNNTWGVYCNTDNSCGGTTVWTNASDERLKTNINDLAPAAGLDAIMQLRPVTYRWKNASSDAAQGEQLGFIAQEVQPLFPQLVNGNMPTTTITLADGSTTTVDNPLGLSYAGFVVPLVKAVQEIGSIVGTFKDALIAWLGDAANGIEKLFAKEIYAENLHAQRLCLGSTCITESQLRALLDGQTAGAAAPSTPSSPSAPSESEADTESPVIQILGNNPATISVGDSYNDLGATVEDNLDVNLGIKTFVDGTEVQSIQLDTSTSTSYTITYRATDNAGNEGVASRTVTVND